MSWWGSSRANVGSWAGGGPRFAQGLRHTAISGGVAGDHTVLGIRVGDELVSVLHDNGTNVVDVTAEFTITADDTINNTGGSNLSTGSIEVKWAAAI